MSEAPAPGPETGPQTSFAELVAATNYSFLRGASHPADMVAEAIALGMPGIGIADRNSVAGVVRAWAFLKELQVKKPEESKAPWDYYQVISTIPGDQAYRPLSRSTCSLVKKS